MKRTQFFKTLLGCFIGALLVFYKDLWARLNSRMSDAQLLDALEQHGGTVHIVHSPFAAPYDPTNQVQFFVLSQTSSITPLYSGQGADLRGALYAFFYRPQGYTRNDRRLSL